MKKQIVSESENIFLWLVKKKEKEKATSSFFKKKKVMVLEMEPCDTRQMLLLSLVG